ncbi:hypothetical protein B0J18DRAFT_223339 [Chaetomium sp. MPI-SDFR-AT-0129]|nr:hypothetical protein B0J18DRAFT_223339 [Chaetomium sp. MPI-SDFR-AT-0129]
MELQILWSLTNGNFSLSFSRKKHPWFPLSGPLPLSSSSRRDQPRRRHYQNRAKQAGLPVPITLPLWTTVTSLRGIWPSWPRGPWPRGRGLLLMPRRRRVPSLSDDFAVRLRQAPTMGAKVAAKIAPPRLKRDRAKRGEWRRLFGGVREGRAQPEEARRRRGWLVLGFLRPSGLASLLGLLGSVRSLGVLPRTACLVFDGLAGLTKLGCGRSVIDEGSRFPLRSS